MRERVRDTTRVHFRRVWNNAVCRVVCGAATPVVGRRQLQRLEIGTRPGVQGDGASLAEPYSSPAPRSSKTRPAGSTPCPSAGFSTRRPRSCGTSFSPLLRSDVLGGAQCSRGRRRPRRRPCGRPPPSPRRRPRRSRRCCFARPPPICRGGCRMCTEARCRMCALFVGGRTGCWRGEGAPPPRRTRRRRCG